MCVCVNSFHSDLMFSALLVVPGLTICLIDSDAAEDPLQNPGWFMCEKTNKQILKHIATYNSATELLLKSIDGCAFLPMVNFLIE